MDAKLNRTIWGLAKELGLEGEEGRDCLHAVVYQRTGKESLKQLTDDEARKVIRYLGLLKDERKNRPGRASPEQLWKQRKLAAELGLTEEQLLGQVKRDAKVDRLEWQSPEQASNVIEALKAQIERRKEAQAHESAAATN